MEPWIQMIVSVVVAIFASTGFWAFLQARMDAKSVKTRMLVGLGHDRIIYLGLKYIERGYITHDEFENLQVYLYEPYRNLGGNGSAERVMEQVRKLPNTKQKKIPKNTQRKDE